MGNEMKKQLKKQQKTMITTTWLDLPKLREIFEKMLELNIAIKSFQSSKSNDDLYVEMMQTSIYNSKQGLKRIKEVENVESLNSLQWNMGIENWSIMVGILSMVSGSLNDDNFYEMDKKFTKEKKVGNA